MKYDKDYVIKLATSLHLELDDKLIEELVKEINELADITLDSDATTVVQLTKDKIVNCSKLKEDKPIKTDVDALSGCKKADKYVVGK